MLEGFDSFYNDVNYDEVTKTQHAVMRARWGAVQLKNAIPMKSIDIKLADNTPWPVHRGSPKTTRNNFLTPNCLFTIQHLSYGATTTIKGSFILEHPMLKRFSAAKKQSPVKIDPQNAGFSEI